MDVPSSLCSRRDVCAALAAVVGTAVLNDLPLRAQGAKGVHFAVSEFDRTRILTFASQALLAAPVTIVQSKAPGQQDAHTFYSEQQTATAVDNKTIPSPTLFLDHVDLLYKMNRNLSALTAAWRLTNETKYFDAARAQASAWFLLTATHMLPTLQNAGVVAGENDDRNNGFIHAVVLAETARALAFLCAAPAMPDSESAALRQWFADLLTWCTDSKKGSIAQQSKTLDTICWAMLVSEFARFTRNDAQFRACAHLFRDGLLRQMHFDGYFPLALRSINPYANSMFTLECMASACESLSTPFDSLWKTNLPDGRGMHSAVAWAVPYLRDRGKWPNVADRDYFRDQPVRQNSLLLAGRAYDLPEYIDLWKTLRPDVASLAREHPLTQPALWATRPPA